METTVQTDNRSDGFDIEAFEAMLESEAFRTYTQRVSRELVRLMADCQRLDEPRDVYRAQGAAQMVEALLRLPAVIKAEMVAGMKAKNAPPKKPRS